MRTNIINLDTGPWKAPLVLLPLLLLFMLVSCDDRVVGPAEVIKRTAAAETFFVSNPDSALQIGGVAAIDLEAKGQILHDSVVDSFEGDKGTDIISINVRNTGNYHFRLPVELDIDVELIDPFNSTVFRLSPAQASWGGQLQAGKYGVKLYNNKDYSPEADNRKLIFMRPDIELAGSDPLNVKENLPVGNLHTDHYTVFTESECNGCDFYQGRMSHFIFHSSADKPISLLNVNLKDARLDTVKIRNATISGQFATAVSFTGSDLRGSHLKDFTEISHSNFDYCDFNGSKITGLRGRYTAFNYCDLRKAKIMDCEFDKTSLIGCTSLSMEMRDCKLPNSNFTYLLGGAAVMADCDFSSSVFNEADLVGSNLTGSSFDRCDMTNANLSNTGVSGASFCNIFKYRGLSIGSAQGIAEATCLLELIELMEGGGGN